MMNFAVVGAGVVGLSVALKLTDEYDSDTATVTVIAESFYNQTCSFGSGGLWEPYQIMGTPESLVNAWGKVVFNHFREEFYGPDGARAGIQLMTTYQLLEEGDPDSIPSWSDIVINFTVLDRKELDKLGVPAKYTKAFSFGTFVVEQKYYLKYLMTLLESRGVVFEQRKLQSLAEFDGSHYDCIVNCCGIGAAKLLKDNEMYPIRGQVLRLR